MFGINRRSAQPQRETSEALLEALADTQDPQGAGPVPPVADEDGGRRAPAESASDQAYGTAVPRTEPSKRGKDKTGKYKTRAWATQRQFDQLSTEQKAMLEDLAIETAKERVAVPRGAAEDNAPAETAPVAPVSDTAVGPTENAPVETDANAAEGPSGPEPTAGALLWGSLDAHRRAGFLNITAAMRGNNFDLAGLKLFSLKDFKNSGIQQDRLMFRPESGRQIRADLDKAIANRKQLGQRGFKKDKPLEGEHPGMAEWGGRQQVAKASMQVGGGSGGVFVDIDVFNPKGNFFSLIGHGFEVMTPGKTDPFEIARDLDERGDDP
jgi:hypothetical protein